MTKATAKPTCKQEHLSQNHLQLTTRQVPLRHCQLLSSPGEGFLPLAVPGTHPVELSQAFQKPAERIDPALSFGPVPTGAYILDFRPNVCQCLSLLPSHQLCP